jgi:hypothetical protein
LHVLRTQIPEHYLSENSGIIMVLGKKSSLAEPNNMQVYALHIISE